MYLVVKGEKSDILDLIDTIELILLDTPDSSLRVYLRHEAEDDD